MSDYTVSRFVFHYTLQVAGGVSQTYYVTTHGFRTKATDTPANFYIEERVESAGSVKRGLFSGARAAGASSPSYGVTTLVNTDGGLDDFVKYAAGGYVTCYYGDDTMAFPNDYAVVYTTKVFSVVADFEKVTVRYQDRISDLDKPVVTAMYAGTGKLEGYEGITARKAVCFGLPGMMPLTLVNKEFQVYALQWNAVDAYFIAGIDPFAKVFEGGVPVLKDPNITTYAVTNSGNYILATDLLLEATKPAPGHYRMWLGYGGIDPSGGFYSQADANVWDYGPVFIRMGTPPTSELRFGMRGFLRNPGDSVIRPWRFSDLCNRAGMQDVTPFSLGDVNGVADDFDAGNRFIDDDRTFLAVMNDRAQALLGFFGFDRLGKFYCGRLRGPESGADESQFTFTFENSSNFLKEPIEGMESPAWQFTVNSGATRPMTPLAGASLEMADLLARDPWYVTFTGTSTPVQLNYPGAKTVSFDIQGNDFQSLSTRQEFMDRFAELYGKQRDFVSLTTQEFTPKTLELSLHDKVTLEVPRFGYDAGTLFRIVDIETNLDNKEIRFGLWGNAGPAQTWVLGGGGYPASSGNPGGSDGGGGVTPPGGSGPPGGGGGTGGLTNPSYTQTVMAALGQEMLCVDTPPGIVQEYTMADMEQITKVLSDGDPGFYDTLALHHFEDLLDSSGYQGTVSLLNGATLTSAQSKFGGSSLFVDGTNDYGVIPFNSSMHLLAQNFSLECYVYIPSGVTPTAERYIMMLGSSTGWGLGFKLRVALGVELQFSINGTTHGGGTLLSPALTRDTWHWLLMHRSGTGTTIRFLLDGVLVGNYSVGSFAAYDFTSGIGLGAFSDGVNPSGTRTSLYIDEVRLVRGYDPYSGLTAPYTVPTAAFSF